MVTISKAWHGEHIARTLLGQEADRQFLDGAYETAARLYYDKAHARGVVSRRAFSRSLRGARVNPVRVDGLLRELDRQVIEFEKMAAAYGAATLRKREGRLSPLDYLIGEAASLNARQLGRRTKG